RVPWHVYGDEFRKRGGSRAWFGRGWGRVWRTYDEAITFVHKLGLQSHPEWEAYCRGGRADLPVKAHDIPAGPYGAYGKQFRDRGGFGAWLGTGNRHPRDIKWRQYEDAVRFVNALGLKNRAEWQAYCRGERTDLPKRPDDIPREPRSLYGN